MSAQPGSLTAVVDLPTPLGSVSPEGPAEETAAGPSRYTEIFVLDLDYEPRKLVQLHKGLDLSTGIRGVDVIGDCWRTCIASMLNLSRPNIVPHFMEEGHWDSRPHEAWVLAREWLRSEMQLDLASVYVEAAIERNFLWIASVPSNLGDWKHAVIFRGDQFVWCPSGEFTYSIDQVFFDQHAEVLCKPYDPDPRTEQASFILREQEAAG